MVSIYPNIVSNLFYNLKGVINDLLHYSLLLHMLRSVMYAC